MLDSHESWLTFFEGLIIGLLRGGQGEGVP